MNRILIISLVATLLLGLAVTAAASPLAFTLDWWNAGSGGGASHSADYDLYGTAGQPASGSLSGGDYSLTGGFVQNQSTASTMFLPIIVR